MARSRISRANIQISNDDGSILQSLVAGEQQHTNLTFSWITNLDNYMVRAALIEADNTNLPVETTDGTPMYPTSLRQGATTQYLPFGYRPTTGGAVVYSDPDPLTGFVSLAGIEDATNIVTMVWSEGLVDAFTTQALPNRPAYGFLGVELRDNNTGSAQQIYKPLRGLIEFRYSVNPLT